MGDTPVRDTGVAARQARPRRPRQHMAAKSQALAAESQALVAEVPLPSLGRQPERAARTRSLEKVSPSQLLGVGSAGLICGSTCRTYRAVNALCVCVCACVCVRVCVL